VLEIGFGNGQATIELAVHRPEEGVIAVDVHVSGISRLLEAAEQLTLTNVRVVVGDALVFLERLPSACLDEIRIFFPDPWPKRRHQHRRLIQGRVLRDLTDRLVVGGHLHLVTDIADYADAIELAIEDEPRLRGGRITRPSWRPETRYERAGIESGRTSVDLRAERIA
jgi:tRNA (guanine-N7-)-methyltransferase